MKKLQKGAEMRYYIAVLISALSLVHSEPIEKLDDFTVIDRTITLKCPVADSLGAKKFGLGCNLIFKNGYIYYLYDRANIFQFDSSGNYIRVLYKDDIPFYDRKGIFNIGRDIGGDGIVLTDFGDRAISLNSQLKVEKISWPMPPFIPLHCIRYGKLLFMGGVTKLWNDKISFLSIQDEENYSIDTILAFPEEMADFMDSTFAWRVRYVFTDVDPTGRFCSITAAFLPDLWIVNLKDKSIVRHFDKKPDHYRGIIPISDRNESPDDWFARWTVTNIPFWLNDDLILINRGFGNKTMYIDVYSRDSGYLYSLRTQKPLVYVDSHRGFIYLVASAKGNEVKIERRKLR